MKTEIELLKSVKDEEVLGDLDDEYVEEENHINMLLQEYLTLCNLFPQI
jgi:hypothetical protein